MKRRRFYEKPSEQAAREKSEAVPTAKSNPYVLMMQTSKNGTHLDAPGALDEPSNRRILT